MNQMAMKISGTVYYAWLASAGMPPDLVRRLLDLFGTPENAYGAFQQDKESFRNIISPRIIKALEKSGNDENMADTENLIKKHRISVLRYDDPEYPVSLRDINQAPAILFFQGELSCLTGRLLSMVGSRAASYAGQKAARKLAQDLSRNGVCIVSGLACGIDAASHQGCIDGGNPTAAVTACGLDAVYPRENIRLRDDILEKGGVILSEYAPGEKPAGWHFPFRNRIIAGLGSALVLIEARIRSGSMTSVQHALDQGKDVFVYPGDPESEHFEGNHQLLREGGIYFTSADDILSDLHWLDNPRTVRQNIGCCTDFKAETPEQSAVIHALNPGSLSFEQLIVTTHLDPSALMSTLTILQISGIVESLPGKQYKLKH